MLRSIKTQIVLHKLDLITSYCLQINGYSAKCTILLTGEITPKSYREGINAPRHPRLGSVYTRESEGALLR